MLNGIKKFFKERAENNARRKEAEIKKAEASYNAYKEGLDMRMGLREQIESGLSEENCPAKDIVPKLQSVINNKLFNKYYFSKDFIKREPDAQQCTNEAMAALFVKTATACAQRVLSKDAVEFANTLFGDEGHCMFSRLDWHWTEHDERKLPKYFLAHGLVGLAAKVPQEDKIAFFDACESNVIIKTMAEFGNPVDFAALMYNLFDGVELGDVEQTLFESGVMGLVPTFSDPEKLREAFETLGRNKDAMLVHTLIKHIGKKPADNEAHFDSFDVST